MAQGLNGVAHKPAVGSQPAILATLVDYSALHLDTEGDPASSLHDDPGDARELQVRP